MFPRIGTPFGQYLWATPLGNTFGQYLLTNILIPTPDNKTKHKTQNKK
jgi:hypothetical protein